MEVHIGHREKANPNIPLANPATHTRLSFGSVRYGGTFRRHLGQDTLIQLAGIAVHHFKPTSVNEMGDGLC